MSTKVDLTGVRRTLYGTPPDHSLRTNSRFLRSAAAGAPAPVGMTTLGMVTGRSPKAEARSPASPHFHRNQISIRHPAGFVVHRNPAILPGARERVGSDHQ